MVHVGIRIRVKVMLRVREWDSVSAMTWVWGGNVVWVGDMVREGL